MVIERQIVAAGESPRTPSSREFRVGLAVRSDRSNMDAQPWVVGKIDFGWQVNGQTILEHERTRPSAADRVIVIYDNDLEKRLELPAVNAWVEWERPPQM